MLSVGAHGIKAWFTIVGHNSRKIMSNSEKICGTGTDFSESDTIFKYGIQNRA